MKGFRLLHLTSPFPGLSWRDAEDRLVFGNVVLRCAFNTVTGRRAA
jgi:hypothetical protein